MDLSHSGINISIDSIFRVGNNFYYQGNSWVERKIFDEHLFESKKKSYWWTADFFPDFILQQDFYNNKTSWVNSRGVEFNAGIEENLFVRAQYFETLAKFPNYLDSIVNKDLIIPGQGFRRLNTPGVYDYGYASGFLLYNISRYFSVQFGHDKNFIGDGYRSMLLSDIGFNYPFLRLNGYFGDLQYFIMWAQFQDIDSAFNSINHVWQKKYGVFHYLDWNVTNRLSIGFFESVIWKEMDSTYGYRGFDWQYLNPVIFFRPIEYSLGSPDNVLMGINIKYKIPENLITYGQLLIDEMSYNEYIHNRGYWGNKLAYQLGIKGYNLFNIENLYVQAEHNSASP
ncbi:MAG: hypothetical protein H3C35_01235, partial [Bacteroidetes bacterium]|nr:hypothetical protein [Bacteroidota bacterium]